MSMRLHQGPAHTGPFHEQEQKPDRMVGKGRPMKICTGRFDAQAG